MSRTDPIRLGGVGPLTQPGLSSAGHELLAGMELAVQEANAHGGIAGRSLELLFEDTCGLPDVALDALKRLRSAGACALVGEFHSVVTDALAQQADRARMPFVCSSATLDAVTARRSPYIFRLAPPQSYGWLSYADFLLARGYRHVIEVIREDIYWNGGAAVLHRRLQPAGVRVSRIAVAPDEPAPAIAERVEALVSSPQPLIALLLVGYPEPLGAIVRELARRERLDGLSLGDPAGRPVFADWWETVGDGGAAVPYLSYELPGRLTPTGRRVARAFHERHGREPSFVALEGYDTIAVLARALERAPDLDAESICAALRIVEAPATRGVVRFSVEPDGVVHQQWAWPPVCVAARGRPSQPLSEADILWVAQETGAYDGPEDC